MQAVTDGEEEEEAVVRVPHPVLPPVQTTTVTTGISRKTSKTEAVGIRTTVDTLSLAIRAPTTNVPVLWNFIPTATVSSGIRITTIRGSSPTRLFREA